MAKFTNRCPSLPFTITASLSIILYWCRCVRVGCCHKPAILINIHHKSSPLFGFIFNIIIIQLNSYQTIRHWFPLQSEHFCPSSLYCMQYTLRSSMLCLCVQKRSIIHAIKEDCVLPVCPCRSFRSSDGHFLIRLGRNDIFAKAQRVFCDAVQSKSSIKSLLSAI